MNDEFDKRLKSWGSRSTPEVDGAFANRLESDLRSTTFEPARRGPRFDLLFHPRVVLTVGFLLAGIAALMAIASSGSSVQMAAANGTTVSIPGQSELADGVAGLLLPEGTQITVGQDGSAVVNGVVLEAGTIAVVVNGSVELIDGFGPPATSSTPATPSTLSDAPSTTARPNVTTSTVANSRPSDGSGSTRPDSTTAPPRPSTSTTSANESGISTTTTIANDSTTSTATDTRSSTSTTATTSAPPTTVASTTVVDQPLSDTVVVLSIGQKREGFATLNWTYAGSDDVSGWVIRRRVNGTSNVIATIRNGDVTRLRVEVPDGNVAFRVIARSADGAIIAESRLVAVR